MSELYKDRDWLYQKYVNESLSSIQIAKMVNVSQQTIWTWLKKFNIQTRNVGIRLLPNPEVDEYFYEVIDGLMIGDGCLRIPNGYKNANFIIAQIEKQSEFIYWITEFLDKYNIDYKIYKRDKHKNGYIKKDGKVGIRNPQLIIETKRYELFNDIYYKHYNGKKRLIPKDIKLTPLQLVLWYMSDGSLYKSNNANVYKITLSTYRYHIDDLQWLVDKIDDLYNIKFYMIRDNRIKDKNYGYTLTTGKKEYVYKFCELVEPYICDCFKYKIRCLEDEQWLSKL
jgi:phage antirepressor YoqD-like protein